MKNILGQLHLFSSIFNAIKVIVPCNFLLSNVLILNHTAIRVESLFQLLFDFTFVYYTKAAFYTNYNRHRLTYEEEDECYAL